MVHLFWMCYVQSILIEPFVPPTCAMLSLSVLPQLEGTEITSSPVHFIVQKVEIGSGPGSSDALYWQNILLHYGAHCGKL